MAAATRAVLANALQQLEAAAESDYYLRVLGDPILKQPTAPVRSLYDVDDALIPAMLRIMNEMAGVGIAAPQVGSNWRLAIARLTSEKREPVVLFNPEIIGWSAETIICPREGCLSCPDDATGRSFFRTSTRRHTWVEISYSQFSQSGKGETERRHRMRLEGFDAQVLQHEVEHLDGRCLFDKLPRQQRRRAEFGVSVYLRAKGRKA